MLADERGRRALRHDAPLVDDDQPVAELLGLIHVVRRQQQRRALLLQPEQPVPQDVPRLRVEPGRRLVEQQDAGVVDEGARDGEAALHAPREIVDLALGPVGELGELEQLVGALAQMLERQAEVAAVDDEVLAHPQLGVEVVGLRHDAEVRPDGGAVIVRVQIEDAQAAARARRDRADHAHGGRLAGAVRTEQPERLPRSDRERDAVDRRRLAVGLDEVDGFDDGGRHPSSLCTSADTVELSERLRP